MLGGMPDEAIYAISQWKGEGFWRMIVKDKYKLVVAEANPKAVSELYDLDADHYEMNNLVGKVPSVEADLMAEYQSWRTKTGDAFPGNNALAGNTSA